MFKGKRGEEGDVEKYEVKGDSSSTDEAEVDLGPCASVPRGRWVTSLTIKHVGKPWESFQYAGIGTRSEFEPTRFTLDFVDYPDRYRVVVLGRCMDKFYDYCIQHRLEWIQPADRDFAKDGEPIILKVEVVKLEEKR